MTLALLSAAAVLFTAPLASHCRILGDANDAESKEIAADVDQAYKRFATHFGATPGPVYIDLREQKERPSQAGRLYLPWLSQADLEKQIGSQVPPEYIDQVIAQIRKTRALSHEVGHMLLIDYVASKEPGEGTKNFGNYGSPHLPDWADEAFAVMCENEASIRARIGQAQAGEIIPAATLFSMEHPHLKQAAPEGAQGAGVRIVGGGASEEQKEHMRKVANFYANVAALTTFIEEKAGTGAFKTIIDGLVDGKEMKDILPSIPKLPPTVAELDSEWAAWMKK